MYETVEEVDQQVFFDNCNNEFKNVNFNENNKNETTESKMEMEKENG